MPVERSPPDPIKDKNHESNIFPTKDGALQINVAKTPIPALAKTTSTMVPLNNKNPAQSKTIMSHTGCAKYDTPIEKKLFELESLCEKLQRELSTLKEENLRLKGNPYPNQCQTPKGTKPKSNFEYLTDEEELTRETDWIVKKSKNNRSKKRKAESSPEVVEVEEETPSCSKQSNQTGVGTLGGTTLRNVKPPPIMISGIKEYNLLHQTVRSLAKKEFSIKLLNNDVYKINASDSTDYRNITAKLSANKSTWYTYQDKQTRPINVMARNLHHSCPPTEIVDDLKQQGFKILNAVNKLQWKTKKPLNLFMLSFDSSEDAKKIHGIRSILNCIVKIEPIRASPLIPQCKNCQAFGHTKNYCSKQVRCVKCGGRHTPETCQLKKTDQPKCCNCGENHPANYRGCAVAKELQKIRDQRKKDLRGPTNELPKNLTTKSTSSHSPSEILKSQAIPQMSCSYAQVTKTGNPSPAPNNDADILVLLKSMISNQDAFMKHLEQRLAVIELQLINHHHERN